MLIRIYPSLNFTPLKNQLSQSGKEKNNNIKYNTFFIKYFYIFIRIKEKLNFLAFIIKYT
jgi:hypothetical protein